MEDSSVVLNPIMNNSEKKIHRASLSNELEDKRSELTQTQFLKFRLVKEREQLSSQPLI